MTIFDASSLFNLHNGALFPAVLKLSGMTIAFGPQVRYECRTIGTVLDKLVAAGSAELLSDDELPFSRFVELSEKYQLGPGETESLILAEYQNCAECCDDLKARRMVSKEIGVDRLTGTIGLIHVAFAEGILNEQEARAAHSIMIASGGFLPELALPSYDIAATSRLR